jgi:transposase
VTPALDDARYQRRAVVKALAASPGIGPLHLPSCSPSLSLIEGPWRLVKKGCPGRVPPT